MEDEMEDVSCWLMYPICGVYALWAGTICTYVGATTNVGKRLKQHLRRMAVSDKFYFTRVTVKVCEPEELSVEEAKAIIVLKPKWNKKSEGIPIDPEDFDLELTKRWR